MNKMLRILFIIFAGLLALILSLSLLTVVKAAANSTAPTAHTMLEPPQAPLKANGGADNFGYTYQDETELFGPTYAFTNISGTGTNLNLDDEDKAVITTTDLAGFDFDFYGTALSSLRVGNNGAILINPTTTKISHLNACSLSSAYPDHQNLVAPWWDDWGDQGNVFWEIQGTAPDRRLIIQWTNMVHFQDSGSNGVTFEVVFFETSNLILFQYQDTTTDLASVNDGNSGTIGILADDTNYLQYETCNSGSPLTANRAIRYQQSSITVVKTALPDNDSQSFEFSGSGDISGTFYLDDNLDPTYPVSHTFFLLPGTYAITETLPTDWDLAGISCGTPNLATGRVDLTLGPADQLTCVFTNTKRGSITVIKDATPNSTQPFTFTGDLTTSFILDDNGTLNDPYSNVITFTSLQSGTYDITEASVPGWTLTNINCTGGDFTEPGGNTARVFLDPGEAITCTFDNTKLGRLLIQKVTAPPGLTTTFAYTASSGLTPITFTLTHGNSQNFNNITPGSYAITETVPSGWTMDSACDDGSTVDNISIGVGEFVTCVFTNTADPGTVTVQKVTVPAASPGVFTFTTDLSTTTSFTLSHGNSQNYNNVTVGTYSISETVPTGWTLTSSCSDGSPINAVNVGPGEDITCVFTNTSNLGSITVQKVTTPTTSSAFTFTTSLTTANFTLSNGGSRTFSNVTSGSSYTVAETTPTDWDLTSTCSDGSPINNIAVSPGEAITCIFTNTQRGAIIIDKVTVPSSNTTSFNFALTGGPDLINWTPALSNTTTPTNSGSIKPGSYNLSETSVTGWSTVASCDNGDDPTAGNITLDAGETITCVYTNTKLSTLIVHKVTDPSPDPTTTSFSFTAGGLTPSSFSLANGGIRTFTNVVSGTYSLSETVPSGWSLTATCDNSDPIATIGLGIDETVTCVFTNTAIPGSITIIKDTVPDNTQDFSFIGNPSIGAFTLDDGADADIYSNTITFSNLPLGSYTVGELATAGWTLNNITCFDPTSDTTTNPSQGQANIDLNYDENVTCTFTNTVNNSLGSITIIKDATPDDSQPFAFSGSLGNFTLIDNGNPFSSTLTQLNLSPGSYSVTEGAVSGWNLTGLSCTDPDNGTTTAGSTATIDLDAGENVTCTFSNSQATPSTIFLPAILKDYTPPACTDIDLEVTGLSINGGVVTVVVENTGTCPTDSGFWVDLYADPQTEPGTLVGVTNDRRWNSPAVQATHGMGWEVPALDGGTSITLTSDGSVGPSPTDKTWPPTAGATILAYADSFDTDDPNNKTFVEIVETSESNNQSTATITFSGLGQSATSSSTEAVRRDVD
ncbi:MAG: hypothetical protein KDI79_01575 [Anaerolineae bacterium]|nr:hypothetical protein [Anaerolineae bacterium]